jgi:hypothetical protein
MVAWTSVPLTKWLVVLHHQNQTINIRINNYPQIIATFLNYF